MSAVCPAGHTSAADDYCDVCGMPIDAQPPVTPTAAPAPVDVPAQAPGGQPCPNCSTPNAPDALFCETCGYDFTTGTMPRPLAPDTAWPRRTVAAPTRRSRRTGSAAPAQSGPAVERIRLGRRGLDRPGLVPGSGEPRPDALARAADGRPAARDGRMLVGRVSAQPQHPSRYRLRIRLRSQPPPGPADHRRDPLVGGGPGIGQRHLRRRRERRAARGPDPGRRQARARSPTTGSTSAPGPGS